jgi:hypothetical protein
MTDIAPIIQHCEIVKGDDFKAAEGRALTWQSPQWPNIAGATLSMIVGSNMPNIYGALPLTWTGSVPAGTPIWLATIELSHVQTEAITEGCWDYTLTATLPDGDRVTLATGQLTVLANPAQAPFVTY